MNMPRREYMKDASMCDVYLKRLQFFLDILNNPERKIPHYIHVGGTSGKGSIVNMLHGVLLADGKKVGSHISPHATQITERWRIGNREMSKKEFVNLVKKIKPALDEYIRTSPYDMLSFFELNVAMTYLYFAENKVKWAVIEVGCGGRYEGTNIMPYKDVAIITNIGKDHTHILGNTKKQIAYEKAGIIKKGCHVFTMEKNSKILDILKKEAETVKAKSFTQIKYKDKQGLKLKSIGEHQKKNAFLVLSVAKKIGISEKNALKGLSSVKQPLRLEVVSDKPMTILDSAHNTDKMKTTVTALEKIGEKKEVNLVLGFSQNKEWKKMIDLLLELKPKKIFCTRQTQNIYRTVVTPQDISNYIKSKKSDIKTEIYIDPVDAFDQAKKKTKKSDIILLTGSLFLSGEIKPHLTS